MLASISFYSRTFEDSRVVPDFGGNHMATLICSVLGFADTSQTMFVLHLHSMSYFHPKLHLDFQNMAKKALIW